jgi:hypothetical protein
MLQPLNASIEPYGQFDGYDSQITLGAGGFKGGEVCQFTYVAIAPGGTDQAAFDASGFDGYVGTVTKTRPCVTHTLTDGVRPLFLSDDGAAGYGTLFGQLVGQTVGKVLAGPQQGPHTAAGSGKITLWDAPGFYAITLDNVAADIADPKTSTLSGNDALYATTAGLLTHNALADFDSSGVVVARFSEYQTNGSLVTTPNTLVSALNSPSGGTAAQANFTRMVIYWNPVI